MERVASSAYQWTGVAVCREGRIFVNYPTWDDHPAYKVAELVQGSAKAYPDMQANDQFICVQSVVVDGKNRLWILDTAKLRGKAVDASGAKLFQVDLQSLSQQYRLHIQEIAQVGDDIRLNLTPLQE